MDKSIIGGAIAVMIVLVLATIILRSPSEGPKGGIDTSYDASVGAVSTGNTDTMENVAITASIGQPVVAGKLTLTVLSIVEESRCPSDVQCIQAGRVRAEVKIVSPTETSTNVIEPSTTVAVDGYSVSLVSVQPYPNTKIPLTTADYRLNFVISSR